MSSFTDDLTVRPLNSEDASDLSALLLAQTPAYVRFFTPFDFELPSVAALLAEQGADVFMGMYWRDRLIGFFMLRGWNSGYEIPAYGVLIDEQYSGYELTRLSLKLAKSICKLRHVPRIMLKVNAGNIIAKRLFEESGFTQTGVDAQTGNLIYYFDFGHH
ncbi:MAG TPA: GNAT family N-acetyltransferase [Pyrinomonadaceae bacterium]|nr:GNAT family N-acetyltransferase [Pyrinomonadaceae bacterium]